MKKLSSKPKKSSKPIVITLSIIAILNMMKPQPVFAGEFITFGTYPQTEVSSPSSSITNASYDANGDAVIDEQKYRRVEDIEYDYTLEKVQIADGPPLYNCIPYVKQRNGYRYFQYEPIQWEKIELSGEEYLLAKSALDAQPYDRQQRQQIYIGNDVFIDISGHSNWNECSLRAWLNDDFIHTAFTEEEKSQLQDTSSGDKVSLLSSAEVTDLSRLANPPQLNKTASDYAVLKGSNDKALKKDEGSFFQGGCEWILRDILTLYDKNGNASEGTSPRYVLTSGSLSTGQFILVSYDSAIVPLIKISSAGIPSYTETNDKVVVYRPWGEAKKIPVSEFDTYMNNGWFQSPGAARNVIADHINNKFKASEAYPAYAGCVKSWATVSHPQITIVYDQKENPTFQDIASFVDGLIDGTLTGRMEDYMCFNIKLPAHNQYKEEQEALQAMYTEWGRVVNSPRASYFIIEVNGKATFNDEDTDYFNKITEIANGARQYSADQEQQLGYIKTWFAQNAYYEGRAFNNNPISLILHGKGICGTYANAVKDICVLLDIPCMVISNKNRNHGWNCLYVNNSWHELDFTGENEPYTDGETILMPVTYSTNDGDEISPEWFNYMQEIYQDNTLATVAQTQQIQNTIYNASEIRININGQDIPFAHAPVLNAGKVYAVYEDIAQAYGAVLTRDDSSWITMSKNGVNIKFSLNTQAGTVIHVKGPDFKMASSFSDRPYWSDGLFYVPIADIIEGLNLRADVSWNPDERCVFITD